MSNPNPVTTEAAYSDPAHRVHSENQPLPGTTGAPPAVDYSPETLDRTKLPPSEEGDTQARGPAHGEHGHSCESPLHSGREKYGHHPPGQHAEHHEAAPFQGTGAEGTKPSIGQEVLPGHTGAGPTGVGSGTTPGHAATGQGIGAEKPGIAEKILGHHAPGHTVGPTTGATTGQAAPGHGTGAGTKPGIAEKVLGQKAPGQHAEQAGAGPAGLGSGATTGQAAPGHGTGSGTKPGIAEKVLGQKAPGQQAEHAGAGPAGLGAGAKTSPAAPGQGTGAQTKPSIGDKVIGKTEELVGKVSHNPVLQEKGELRSQGQKR